MALALHKQQQSGRGHQASLAAICNNVNVKSAFEAARLCGAETAESRQTFTETASVTRMVLKNELGG